MINATIDPPPENVESDESESVLRRGRTGAVKERISICAEESDSGLTASALAALVGGNRNAVFRLIKELIADGYLASSPGPRGSLLSSLRVFRSTDTGGVL